jgi:hypothetical protein
MHRAEMPNGVLALVVYSVFMIQLVDLSGSPKQSMAAIRCGSLQGFPAAKDY